MAQLRSRLLVGRCAWPLRWPQCPRIRAYARADSRKMCLCWSMPRATRIFARARRAAPLSSVCGKSARYPTIGRFRLPPMRNLSRPSMVFCRERVKSLMTGTHRRSHRLIARMAASIRCPRASHISGRGRLLRTGPTGSRIPNIGKASRAASRIVCPMRCTSGLPSGSSTVAPAC